MKLFLKTRHALREKISSLARQRRLSLGLTLLCGLGFAAILYAAEATFCPYALSLKHVKPSPNANKSIANDGIAIFSIQEPWVSALSDAVSPIDSSKINLFLREPTRGNGTQLSPILPSELGDTAQVLVQELFNEIDGFLEAHVNAKMSGVRYRGLGIAELRIQRTPIGVVREIETDGPPITVYVVISGDGPTLLSPQKVHLRAGQVAVVSGEDRSLDTYVGAESETIRPTLMDFSRRPNVMLVRRYVRVNQ